MSLSAGGTLSGTPTSPASFTNINFTVCPTAWTR